MWNLIDIVIPRIQADWEDLAYPMQYDVHTVKTIAKDAGDSRKCCRRLLEDWITMSNSVAPKNMVNTS